MACGTACVGEAMACDGVGKGEGMQRCVGGHAQKMLRTVEHDLSNNSDDNIDGYDRK